MPIYEYKCNICGNIHDVEHSIRKSPTIIYCPKCKLTRTHKKLISKTNFSLAWRPPVYPGKKTRIKTIGGQTYDEQSYNAAKRVGVFRPKKSTAMQRAKDIARKVVK